MFRHFSFFCVYDIEQNYRNNSVLVSEDGIHFLIITLWKKFGTKLKECWSCSMWVFLRSWKAIIDVKYLQWIEEKLVDDSKPHEEYPKNNQFSMIFWWFLNWIEVIILHKDKFSAVFVLLKKEKLFFIPGVYIWIIKSQYLEYQHKSHTLIFLCINMMWFFFIFLTWTFI